MREAAAVHTPAILLEGSTAAELIRHEENGFLTQRTPEAYADIITHIASNPNLIRKAGKGASLTLTRTWKDVMNEVIQRYDEIIARHEHTRQ